MLTIKLGKQKVKVFNLLILILILIFFIYVIGSLIFLLPCFRSEYKHKISMNNYSITANVTFKKSWFSCTTIEKLSIKSDDKMIKNELIKDLLSDGYKKNKDYYVKTKKETAFCRRVKKDYKKTHNNKYVEFKINGDLKDKLLVNTNYVDKYVIAKVNNKVSKSVKVISSVNENVVGTYLVKYVLSVNKDYKLYLYKTVSVYDDVAPVITLNGDSNITLDYKSKYKEPGYTAEDNYDGIITDKVVVDNKIDTTKAGTYVITYLVTDANGNSAKVQRNIIVKEEEKEIKEQMPSIETKDGITYVNGILLVNKTYGLPKDYDPGVNSEAYSNLKAMQADASALGLNLSLQSGYRSYNTQKKLYNDYVKQDGEKKASMYSAKPGYSEHQTGLAFDVGSVDSSFANTDSGKWLAENCHLYGFIIRYPKDKTDVTGYIYEPWHVRYLGVDTATKVKNSGLALEEYLKVN